MKKSKKPTDTLPERQGEHFGTQADRDALPRIEVNGESYKQFCERAKYEANAKPSPNQSIPTNSPRPEHRSLGTIIDIPPDEPLDAFS